MKKTLRLCLVFTALVTALNFTISAAPVAATVSGAVGDETSVVVEAEQNTADAQNILSGEGTQESPYIILNEADFLTAAQMVSSNNSVYGDGVYSIEKCLDFDGVEFVPIGTESTPFKGTLLGNGHKLKNITLSDVSNFGVVGYMKAGSVKDVRAEYSQGSYTTSNVSCFGGVIGCIDVGTASAIYVSGCSASGNVHITTEKAIYFGGFVGNAKADIANLYFSDCISYMDVSATVTSNSNIGGFVGKAYADPGKHYCFERCIAYGDVTASITANNGNAGGFVGYAFEDEKYWSEWFGELASDDVCFLNSIAFGNVTLDSNAYCSAGGFTGQYNDLVKIGACYTSSEQVVTALTITTPSSQTVCDITKLKSSTYLSETLGYNFDTVFVMDEDGFVRFANDCSGCTVDVPKELQISFTENGVTVQGVDGEYVLVISCIKDKVLDGIKFADVSADGEITFEAVGLAVEKGDTVKAFLFETKESMKPVCESIAVNL